jgi:hypothetical protein
LEKAAEAMSDSDSPFISQIAEAVRRVRRDYADVSKPPIVEVWLSIQNYARFAVESSSHPRLVTFSRGKLPVLTVCGADVFEAPHGVPVDDDYTIRLRLP